MRCSNIPRLGCQVGCRIHRIPLPCEAAARGNTISLDASVWDTESRFLCHRIIFKYRIKELEIHSKNSLMKQNNEKNVTFKLSRFWLVQGCFAGALGSEGSQIKCSGQATTVFLGEEVFDGPVSPALYNMRVVLSLA